jgi:hypothetical protein
LKLKDEKKGFFSSKSRKVNFVIFVLNGVSVLNVMENAGGALEARYIEEIVSTFNFPFLSFKGIFWTKLVGFLINLIESQNARVAGPLKTLYFYLSYLIFF